MQIRDGSGIVEILEQVEFIRSVLAGRIEELKERLSEGRYTRGVLDEIGKVAEVLDKYISLLIKLKREFRVVFEVGDEMERELVWEFRAIEDIEKKKKILEFIRKMKKGGEDDNKSEV